MDAGRGERFDVAVGITKEIDGFIVREVAAFDKDGGVEAVMKFACCRFELVERGDRPIEDDSCLIEIGSEERGAGKEFRDAGSLGIRRKQRVAARCDHDRIDNERAGECSVVNGVENSLNLGCGMKEARFDGPDRKGATKEVYLIVNEG